MDHNVSACRERPSTFRSVEVHPSVDCIVVNPGTINPAIYDPIRSLLERQERKAQSEVTAQGCNKLSSPKNVHLLLLRPERLLSPPGLIISRKLSEHTQKNTKRACPLTRELPRVQTRSYSKLIRYSSLLLATPLLRPQLLGFLFFSFPR